MRDDFNANTKNTLARRAGMRCCNPKCRKPTVGPHDDPIKAVNIGIAAHIKAASKGGPRYDEKMNATERSSIKNAIWLCQNCAKLVDSNCDRFTVKVLKRWKRLAEEGARLQLEMLSPENPTSSIEELIALVNVRANLVLREMDDAKRYALEFFRNAQEESSNSKDELKQFISKALPLLRSFGIWDFNSEDDLCLKLDSLKHSFIELHGLYKNKLQKGNFVTAHEIMRQMHSIIEEYNNTCNPLKMYWGIKISMSCPMPFFFRYDEDLKMNEKYPGLIPKNIVRNLPGTLVKFLLIKGKKYENYDKIIHWTNRYSV